ncbi:hypothetical protein PINS_up002500 [Pythium insidiosum]|nr:hypothetical protein PINS_up002500 [Pythium insidiosum]
MTRMQRKLEHVAAAYIQVLRLIFGALRRHHTSIHQLQRDKCARILQRTLGVLVVRRRLLQDPTFARFQELRQAAALKATGASSNCRNTIAQLQRELSDARLASKKLQATETELLSAIDALHQGIREATKRRDDERDRAQRFRAWLDTRRAKSDELLQARLAEWELRKRFEIRMELERELERERRAQLHESRSNNIVSGAC